MIYIISGITVPRATTVINAILTFVNITIPLSLVVVLVYFMPKTGTASSWSSISTTLHSSIWPTILRIDGNSRRQSGVVVSTLTRLAGLTIVLVAVAGIVLPLGLDEGPIVPSNFRQVDAEYLPDTSALALATRPDRESFTYGRRCVKAGLSDEPCPGNGDNLNTSTIAPSLYGIFNSTPHGAFSMQYRQFFDGGGAISQLSTSVGVPAMSQTLIMQNNTFVIDGLIVDMSPEHPGVGFWNQSLPKVANGGTWSQDILWLEPLTECADTNLTVDYTMARGETVDASFNITDHGGFTNLVRQLPTLNPNGQQVDLAQQANMAGIISNPYAMLYLNATRDTTSIGKPYVLNTDGSRSLRPIALGKLTTLPLSYLNSTSAAMSELSAACRGFGSSLRDNTPTNITKIHMECGIFLGPPLRTDGGDPREFDTGSKWSQAIHSCSSTTRASIQRFTFQGNGTTTKLGDLRISRQPTNLTVLWGMEKADFPVTGIDLLWARIDDQYENDPSLWTVRSNHFYLPATRASVHPDFPSSFPGTEYSYAWSLLYANDIFNHDLADYSKRSDFATKTKLQSLVEQNPTVGNAQIRNLMWVDIMANNLVGTQFNSTVWAADNLTTVTYDFRYAIPGFVLLAIWAPSFLMALFLLVTRLLRIGHMKNVLNHTSVGRVVVGTSALRVIDRDVPAKGGGYMDASDVDLRHSSSHAGSGSDWPNNGGGVRVALELNRSGN